MAVSPAVRCISAYSSTQRHLSTSHASAQATRVYSSCQQPMAYCTIRYVVHNNTMQRSSNRQISCAASHYSMTVLQTASKSTCSTACSTLPWPAGTHHVTCTHQQHQLTNTNRTHTTQHLHQHTTTTYASTPSDSSLTPAAGSWPCPQDSGLNCRGVYLTDPRLLASLAPRHQRAPLAVQLHGTPRQWGESVAGWS